MVSRCIVHAQNQADRFAPYSSAKMNLTKTIAPRSEVVVRGIGGVVPQLGEHRTRGVSQGGRIGRRLVGQVVL